MAWDEGWQGRANGSRLPPATHRNRQPGCLGSGVSAAARIPDAGLPRLLDLHGSRGVGGLGCAAIVCVSKRVGLSRLGHPRSYLRRGASILGALWGKARPSESPAQHSPHGGPWRQAAHADIIAETCKRIAYS